MKLTNRLPVAGTGSFRRAPWVLAVVPFFLWGLRSTILNGLVDPFRVTKFRGDFSGALFDLFWWQGTCKGGELVRGVDIAYGPLFTLLHHAVIDSQESCGPAGLVVQTHIGVDLLLYLVTAANLLLIIGSIWLMRKLFEFDNRQTLLVATLWLVDFHLGFSLGVAAILEFLELFLLLAVLVNMRRPGRLPQIESGVLLGVWLLTRKGGGTWLLEWSVVLIAAVLLVPKNEYYYFCLLVFPFVVAVRECSRPDTRLPRVLVGAAYVMIGVPVPLALVYRVLPGSVFSSPSDIATRLLEWNVPFLGAVTLLAALVILERRAVESTGSDQDHDNSPVTRPFM